MRKRKFIFALFFFVAIPFALSAREEDNTFGGWEFMEINHDFRNGMYASAYIEHDNYQYRRLECFYGRFSFGFRPLKWLKLGLNYVPLKEPGQWKNFMETDLVGALNSGNFKVSIRERYRHCFTTDSNELRSRLKVAYLIPDSRFSPYLAVEVFTWGTQWKKTRHYVACCYDLNETVQFESYYLYYAFNGAPAEHVIGLGININL